MQKRLLQRDLARILGVSTACITNWENGNSEPQLQYFPTITSFLGFSPFSANHKTFPERLRAYRLERGLSFKRMGLLFDVHGSTVISWEKGAFVPAEETLKKLRDMGNLDLEELLGN